MMYLRSTQGMAILLATAALGASAIGLAKETINVRKDSVVLIRFDEDLDLKRVTRGERVMASVEDDRDLPFGSRFEGRVRDYQRWRGDEPGYVQIEFSVLQLPDGSQHRIRAVPVSLRSEHVVRGGDGRFRVRREQHRPEQLVFGGLVAGAILGGLIDKPFEGAFLGTLAGIILAETERAEGDANVVIRKGTRMGALFERDFRAEYSGPWGARRAGDGLSDPRDAGRRDDDAGYDPRAAQPVEGPVRVLFDKRELRYDGSATPYRIGKTWMLPLDDTAKQLGFSVEALQGARRVYIENEDTSLIFERESNVYRLNGKKWTMGQPLVERDGVLYAPAEAFSKAASGNFEINGTKVEV